MTQIQQTSLPIIESIYLTPAVGKGKIDLRPQLESVVIFEDIFAPVLRGEITIADNIGLFDHLPISGNEQLTIKFCSSRFSKKNSPIDYIHRTFDILKVTEVFQINDYNKRYTLSFASPELKINESIKISKTYTNTPISGIVAEIMTGDSKINDGSSDGNDSTGLDFTTLESKEFGPGNQHFRAKILGDENIEAIYQVIDDNNSVELFIEKTKYKEPYVTVPYMKPFDIIRWLSTRAIRQVSDKPVANFLFFENARGFQYVSLNTLLESRDNPARFVFGSTKQNISDPWNTDIIEDLKIQNCYDVLANIKNGVYSSRLTTYDLSTGTQKEFNYDYLESFKSNDNVNRNGIGINESDIKSYPLIKVDDSGENVLTTQYNSKRMLLPISPNRNLDTISSCSTDMFSSAKSAVGSEEYLQARLGQLSKLSDFVITIEIAGNSRHNVGDIVELDLQMIDLDDNKEKFISKKHKYYSGNYLISSIKHILTNTQYKMQIELTKDALESKIGE